MSARASRSLLFAAFLLGLPSFIQAQTAADAISTEVRGVFDRCKPAVVRIEGRDARSKLLGSGFFIDPNGTLFTSYTIAAESEDLTVIFNDKRFSATRLMADPRSGIALLKIDAETPFLTPATKNEMSIASPVMLIGYPMDLAASPSFGVVAGFDAKYKGKYFCTTHIRASIAVAGGQGGAPMLNLRGEVVGIVISSAVGGGSCFALPIEAAEKVHSDYVRFGQPRPGYLGAELVSTSESATTAQISRLDESGPASSAGVQVGDVVVSLANRPVTTPEDVVNAAFYVSAGDDVPVTVLRNGIELSLTVKAADRPNKDPRVAISPPEVPPLFRTPAVAGSEPQPALRCDPDHSESTQGLNIHR